MKHAPVYRFIRVATDRTVLRLTLARPPLNILSIGMLREIGKALADGRRQALRAVVLSAEGKAFSAGTDIAEHLPPKHKTMLAAFHGIFRTLDAMNVPTIAVVEGAARGGGCELACFCDWVFATPNATFGLPEINLAVFPPAAAAFFASLVGYRRAAKLILTGRVLSAEEALSWGLASRLVIPERIDAEVEAFLDDLRARSAPALRAARKALRASAGRSFPDALKEAEGIYLKDLAKSTDVAEGLKAFLEKRKPRWKD